MAQLEPRFDLLANSLFVRARRHANVAPEFSQTRVDAKKHTALKCYARIDDGVIHLKFPVKMAEQFGRFERCIDRFEFSGQAAVHLLAINPDSEAKQSTAGQVQKF